MRETLNNNPLVQVAIVGVLLIATGFFVVSSIGGGKEGGEASTEAPASANAPEGRPSLTVSGSPETAAAAVPPPGALAEAAPPPPAKVGEAFSANRTVVLLFVRRGGIDDRMVAESVERLRSSLPRAAVFVEPADRVARYAAITQGVNVNRVPALVVVRPKRLGKGIPTASVRYGFQGPESIVQAVVDAGYRGPTVDYHP